MEIRILQKEEIKIASGLSRYVFDYCLRNRMEYPQTIAFVEEYIAEANLTKLFDENKLLLWGAFEEEQMVGVSGLQSDGMITLLYILPQHQNKGYGSMLLKVMREYAKEVCNFSKVTLNANPAWTSFYFGKKGFIHVNSKQSLRDPFVPMYALSTNIAGFEKRPVSKRVIAFAVAGCILFATIVGSLYMISYLF
ncbi:MAG: GNAT family N-acetyltransferase [Roseburia sp.]|nr:GNAT family N-acetyltransferase [Roseburia sp.]MBQ8519590.1 GNAT family N-acetyltransferase [Agathobacter sp.]